jgi:L-ascorbate metabolism protein UlaG (beta-lactamase superfamily)
MKTPFGRQASGLRRERMQSCPRYRDGEFHNVHPVLPGLKSGAMPSIADFLCSGGRRAPSAPLATLDPRPSWSKPAESGLRVTWLGHSTLLVELDGVRLLTDPVWGERVSPVGFVGPKRFQPVPIGLRALPPLDAVIISHDHYDHLDYPTILQLAKSSVPFITSLGVGAHLQAWGVVESRIIELDWWESTTIADGRATITAAPAQHFSGRGPGLRNTTAWSSFAARGSRHSFFFSGDTGLTHEYASIRQRLGPLDLVALEVGAFHPAWGDIHLGPENALEAFRLLGGAHFLPVHWGTFNLAMHDWDEPAEVLWQHESSTPLLMPRLGEAVEPSRREKLSPWWRASGGRMLVEALEGEPPSVNELAAGPQAPVAFPLD